MLLACVKEQEVATCVNTTHESIHHNKGYASYWWGRQCVEFAKLQAHRNGFSNCNVVDLLLGFFFLIFFLKVVVIKLSFFMLCLFSLCKTSSGFLMIYEHGCAYEEVLHFIKGWENS